MGAKQSKPHSLTAVRRSYRITDCHGAIRQCLINYYSALHIYETLLSFLPTWQDESGTNLCTYPEIFQSQMCNQDTNAIKYRVGLISNCPDACFWLYYLLQEQHTNKKYKKMDAWRGDLHHTLAYDDAMFELDILHCEYHPCPEYHKSKQPDGKTIFAPWTVDLEQLVIADIGILLINIYKQDSLSYLKSYWSKMCEFYETEKAAYKANKKKKKARSPLLPTSFVVVSVFYSDAFLDYHYEYNTRYVRLDEKKAKIRVEEIEQFCNETGISFMEVFANRNEKDAHKELCELMCRVRYWHNSISKTKQNALAMFYKTREPSCRVGGLAAAPYPPW